MRDIVIERVMHGDGNPPSLVDQIDSVLKEISFELGRLANEEKEPDGMDSWVDRLREQFWKRQLEIIDDPGRFRIRLAVPGLANGEMHVAISESGIEITGDSGGFSRRIPLPERIDPRTVSAIFDKGYLQVAGEKFGADEKIRLVDATEERSIAQAVGARIRRRRRAGRKE